ncbi:MAG TPA: hypothetical protein VF407_19510 [Polyangiaceae bacterium]
MILSTTHARLVFGLSILMAAAAGLGVVSSQWHDDDQEFPAMRAPVQRPSQRQHPDFTPAPDKKPVEAAKSTQSG